jgi:hypothetical protein
MNVASGVWVPVQRGPKGCAPPSGEWGPAALISAIEAQGWAHISRRMGGYWGGKRRARVRGHEPFSFVS